MNGGVPHKIGLLSLAGAALAAAAARGALAAPSAVWERSFSPGAASLQPAAALPEPGAPVVLFEGRLSVSARGFSPGEARAEAEALGARLAPLFTSPSWNPPYGSESRLRIVVYSTQGVPASRVRLDETRADGSIAGRIDLFTGGRDDAEPQEEAARGAALLALVSRSPDAPEALTAAAARAVALPEELTGADREEIREAAASPEGSLAGAPREVLAALWIRELMRGAGPDFLPRVWPTLAGPSDPYARLASAYEKESGEPASEAFGRALRRAYSSVDVIPDLSRLTQSDLEAGGLDASEPGFLSWRYASTEPERNGGERLAWPEDGARGFAVVHYDDDLPVDLVELRPGEGRYLPWNGIARIDWIVEGGEGPASELAAPAAATPQEPFPVAGLSARAESVPQDGVRLEWSTSSHRDLIGWAILRRQVDATGDVVMSPAEWLPARERDLAGSSYLYLDSGATPGRFYRYDVWAVTTEGLLSRCFRVTLRAR